MKSEKMLRASMMVTLCFVSVIVLADVEQEFNRQRLLIEYKEGISGTWSKYGGAVSSYKAWRFRKGFEIISEPEFLRIAGYYEEAEKAEKHGRTIKTLRFIGGAFLAVGIGIEGAGLAMVLMDVDSDSINVEPWTLVLAGGITACVAFIPAGIHDAIGVRWMPLEQAYAIAEDYNERLMKELSR